MPFLGRCAIALLRSLYRGRHLSLRYSQHFGRNPAGLWRPLGLFQAKDRPPHDPISLVGIEEPEASVHPAAAGVLWDAMNEASHFTQVLATTHSVELLDRKDVGPESLLVVEMVDGETRIGPVDQAGQSIIRDRLATPGELLRQNQLVVEQMSRCGQCPGAATLTRKSGRTMIVSLGCIVEGDGEKRAAPRCWRESRASSAPSCNSGFPNPFVVGRNKLVKPGELERTIELVVRRLPAPRGIFILIDADDDCPAILDPQLLARAKQARPDVPAGVVLANREYEAWFLAAIESLAGQCGLPANCRRFSIPNRSGERNSGSPA